MKVCVVVPCYNEATVVGDVVKGIRRVFDKSKFDADIVVVNDRSRDNSAEVAEKAGAIVINHLLNQGAGGATSTGLSFAKDGDYDWALTMDADGQHDPADALRCLEQAKKDKVDLMIGSRLIDKTGMSRTKVIGNWGLSVITRVLFGINATDSQSGLRVFSRKSLDTLEWKTTGYEFCSEMLWRAGQAKLKIAEHPIKAIYTDYSRGKGQNNWNGINIVKSLIKQRFVELFE